MKGERGGGIEKRGREVWREREEEEAESCGCVVEHIEREGRRRREHGWSRKETV